MILERYALICNECKGWLPGIDSWLDTWFNDEDVMLRHAQCLGWVESDDWGSGELSHTCKDCMEVIRGRGNRTE